MGLAAARLLQELGANVYTICRRNGRHSKLDFPVAGELYTDFGVKADLDALADALPETIDAMFLCHGIALKADASNALEVQKVNFLSHKYLLEKTLPKLRRTALSISSPRPAALAGRMPLQTAQQS